MKRLENISIKQKLVLMIMTGSTAALLLASAAFVTVEWISFRQTTVLELATLAEVVGYNSAASITLGVPKDAEDTLSSLSTKPHLQSACIYDTSGAVHAQWVRPGLQMEFPTGPPSRSTHEFRQNYLELFREIQFGGEKIGTVYLRSDMAAMKSRLQRYASIVLLVLIASSLVTWWLSSKLQRLISEPIFRLLNTADQVAREQNYALRAEAWSHDELGLLMKGFNNMLAQIQARDTALQSAQENLEKTVDLRTRELQLEIAEREEAEKKLRALHSQLLEASRRAGMAEVATGVLHNVGNVLNSVNVSTTLVQDKIRQSRLANLRKITALISEHANDWAEFVARDERGKLLPQYLAALEEHLSIEHKEIAAELDLLATNIEHIKKIVTMQQSYATVLGVVEPLPIVELVEDSLRMYADGLAAKGIRVVRQFVDNPTVMVDKHRILQILMNLIANAQYSLVQSGHSPMILRIETRLAPNRKVRIAVTDNGLGIRPENLVGIFSYGFTTKKDGHGFGLHYGALAAQEMGGNLSAESEGEGKGAKFTLELPLDNPLG